MKEKIKKLFKSYARMFANASFVFLLVLPASTNYKLRDYGFGTGGTGNSTDGTYSINAITGEVSDDKLSSSSYGIGPGLIFTNQANVPLAPTFSNPSDYYNKLKVVVDASGNPSDTKFAIAISSDDFVTTRYVQSDNTVGASLGSEDYRTYASWGSASGFLVIGLSPITTYKIKIKAMQGKFTETGYGPIATATTVNPMLSFDVDVSDTDSDTDPPFSINFGDLSPGSVSDSPKRIWIDFSTNGELGGSIYVSGQNQGLLSSTRSHLISAVSADLSGLGEGFGAQGSSATQTSGGPLSISALYNQTGNTVGITDQSFREIFSSSNPISGGRGSFLLKAKSASLTPSANDYSETFTVIACGSF